MADLDLDAIEARANAAGDGPWIVVHEPAWEADDVQHPDVIKVGAPLYVGDDEPVTICLVSTDYEDDPVDVLLDAEFIAHARTDVPALVAALREARAEVERLRLDAGKRLSWAIFAVRDHDAYAQPFVLMRDTDVSGVSGTGVVADGVAFPRRDCGAALAWRQLDVGRVPRQRRRVRRGNPRARRGDPPCLARGGLGDNRRGRGHLRRARRLATPVRSPPRRTLTAFASIPLPSSPRVEES